MADPQRERAERRAPVGTDAQDPAERQADDILEGVARARELELREVMTPRPDVVFLTMPVTPEAVAEAIRDSGHRAFPVALSDELDEVDGVLFVNDLFRSSRGRDDLRTALPDTTELSRKVRRPPLLLPESMAVLEALAEMRAKRR